MGEEKPVAKTPIYKKWWFWTVIAFIVIAGIGSAAGSSYTSDESSDSQSDIGDTATNNSENEELAKLNLHPQKVRNDTTGNWRISVVATPTVIDKYAYDYYKEYMDGDNEIHYITNLTLKTTTKIAKTAAGLNVTVYEYMDGEEHDAKKLGGGQVLSDEYYDSQTGDKIEI